MYIPLKWCYFEYKWKKCKKQRYIEARIVSNKAKKRISKRVFQENKARQIFRKTNVSYLLIRTRMCAYQGVRKVRFLENLTRFVFKTPVLRFALLPYYRWYAIICE